MTVALPIAPITPVHSCLARAALTPQVQRSSDAKDHQAVGGGDTDAGQHRRPDHLEHRIPVDGRDHDASADATGGPRSARLENSSADPMTISTDTTTGPAAPVPNRRVSA